MLKAYEEKITNYSLIYKVRKELSYSNGRRVRQTNQYGDDTTSKELIDFKYKNGLVDSLIFISNFNSNSNHITAVEHDSKGRLISSKSYKNDGRITFSFEIEYLSDNHGIYAVNDSDRVMFFLDERGNIVKEKLLSKPRDFLPKFTYYLMSSARNPNYLEAFHPISIYYYTNYNYRIGKVIFDDSTSNHDSIVLATKLRSELIINAFNYPVEFYSDSLRRNRPFPLEEWSFTYECRN